VRGEPDAPLVIEYGDYECPYCAQADAMLAGLAVRRVFRHFPVVSKHPRARVLAAAAEAAGLQGAYWDFHDSLYADQGRLDDPHLWERVRRLGLDLDRFEADRRAEAVAARVDRDFRSGVRAGVTTTPTLFAAESGRRDLDRHGLGGRVRLAPEPLLAFRGTSFRSEK
jgi:protein-disulfide isomerase